MGILDGVNFFHKIQKNFFYQNSRSFLNSGQKLAPLVLLNKRLKIRDEIQGHFGGGLLVNRLKFPCFFNSWDDGAGMAHYR